MGFIPVQFSPAGLATLKPNHGKTLEFAPSAWSILPLNPHDVADSPAHGDLFNVSNFSNYLKIGEGFHLLISDHGNSVEISGGLFIGRPLD